LIFLYLLPCFPNYKDFLSLGWILGQEVTNDKRWAVVKLDQAGR
jgi:hypothetical protein